ncbi:unnamed protein product [Mytilus edulis]|uniref:Uncharacterized protein n=1 Tax=Mytilus edulis TaxID=6550 RepID=A0A8S3QQU2_MYTED|nr:unnamed protein product [Mytilus edulis]
MDTDTISCALYSAMTIINSTYGRNDGTTCADGHGPYSSGFHCTIDSTDWVTQRCQNKQTCSFEPRSIGIDPCPNKYKYMTVSYTCSDIDECASTPCQNGGTCADLINRYTCTCDSGYTGILCDENYDECSSNPCQYDGTCTDIINGYACNCYIAYKEITVKKVSGVFKNAFAMY